MCPLSSSSQPLTYPSGFTVSKQANKTLIGGFVVGAAALLFVAVLIFGSGKFLRDKNRFVMFFDGSVKGLNQGSPVLFRGVNVGSVTAVKLLANPATATITIPVYVEVDRDRFEFVGEQKSKSLSPSESLKRLIEKGLRAQLEMQSFVTGQLVVALDFRPETPIKFRGEHVSLPEVPTIPSTMQALAKSLEKLPIHDLVEKATSALDGLTKTVNSPEVGETLHKANLALADLRALLKNLDSRVEPLSTRADQTLESFGNLARNADAGLKNTIGDARALLKETDERFIPISKKLELALDQANAALVQVRSTFSGLKHSTGPDSTMINRLGGTLDELSGAARSIRILADYLEAHPEALVRGKSGSGGR